MQIIIIPICIKCHPSIYCLLVAVKHSFPRGQSNGRAALLLWRKRMLWLAKAVDQPVGYYFGFREASLLARLRSGQVCLETLRFCWAASVRTPAKKRLHYLLLQSADSIA